MHDLKVSAGVFELDLVIELHPLKHQIYLFFSAEISDDGRAVGAPETYPDDIAFSRFFGDGGFP